MCMLIALYSLRGVSSQAHELKLQFLVGTDSDGSLCCQFVLTLAQVLPQPLQAQCSPDPGIMPQGSGEGTFAFSECETFGRRVKVRPTSWCSAARVGYDEPGSRLRTRVALRVRPCDDPQQLTLGGSLPAPDARPLRTIGARRDVELWNHRRPLYRGPAANPNS
jgi:hypothetical protein